jgi:predicted CopG family antitoxin
MRKKVYTRQVGVLFSEDTYAELIRITDEIEISVSEFIRRIVETKLNNETEEELNNERT